MTLAASTAFGSFWMMPRLQQFRDELPGIDLRIQTADRDLDIIVEGIPLAVRGGEPGMAGLSFAAAGRRGDIPGCRRELCGEVRAAGYRRGSGIAPAHPSGRAVSRGRELGRVVRTRLGSTSPMPGGGLRINDYALVIQAVMEGQGIALGWGHLAERLLASGLLVRATDHAMTTGKGFHVIWSKNRELSDNARKVRDWLAAQA